MNFIPRYLIITEISVCSARIDIRIQCNITYKTLEFLPYYYIEVGNVLRGTGLQRI